MAFKPDYEVLPPVSTSNSESDDGLAERDSCTIFATSERKHEYRTLGLNEVRLLILNPGLPDEPIECFLEHYSVNQAKKYQALSYAWGDPRDVSSIQVDGCPFQVSRNLKDFLVSYRTNNTCPVLWIDAVCINQHDILERSAQIRLMKRIYEGADIVLIWLGQEVDATESAIEQIQHVYHDFWLPRLEREGSPEKVISSITANDVREIIGQGQEGGGHKDIHVAWDGIQDLLLRPWWSRIWGMYPGQPVMMLWICGL
jgi:Heterokaryon incompatibility protein (HET)